MAVTISEQNVKLSRGNSSADALVAEVQQLRQKVSELEQRLQQNNAALTGLTNSLTGHATTLSNIMNSFEISAQSLKIKHARQVVVEASSIEMTGGGLGCNMRINSNTLDIFSVHARFDVDFMSANTIKTTFSAQSDFAITSSNAKWATSQIKFDTARIEATGIMKCDTMQANRVIGQSYTPGQGNVW